MQRQDAIKARIKKLEGDVLGLMYRLKCLHSAPTFSGPVSISRSFNEKTARAELHHAFLSAAQTRDILQQQLTELRDELFYLSQSYAPAPEFKLAA